jgi:hypothetical protein
MGMTHATFSVSNAERLLATTFHTFRNTKTKQIMRRSQNGLYSLPAQLAAIVSHVEGGGVLLKSIFGLNSD